MCFYLVAVPGLSCLYPQLLPVNTTMADTAFRRIDVDKLEEDVLLATDLYDPDPRGPEGALADARAKVGQVRTALSK